jgi:hypothetical protein
MGFDGLFSFFLFLRSSSFGLSVVSLLACLWHGRNGMGWIENGFGISKWEETK